MKTIARRLKINTFPFEIIDNNGKALYYEDNKGYWIKSVYNKSGEIIYLKDSDGIIKAYSFKGWLIKIITELKLNNECETICEFLHIKTFPFDIKDDKDRILYKEEKDGLTYRHEYDDNGNMIYGENNEGYWFKQSFDNLNRLLFYKDSQGVSKTNNYIEETKEITWWKNLSDFDKQTLAMNNLNKWFDNITNEDIITLWNNEFN